MCSVRDCEDNVGTSAAGTPSRRAWREQVRRRIATHVIYYITLLIETIDQDAVLNVILILLMIINWKYLEILLIAILLIWYYAEAIQDALNLGTEFHLEVKYYRPHQCIILF